MKDETNNSRIRCNGWMPVRDVQVVDAKQRIFRGKRIIEVGSAVQDLTHIFFSRCEKGKEAELDEQFPEFHIHDVSIMGCEFYLVPKQRVLFGYEPESSIIKMAPVKQADKKMPFGGL